MADGHGLTKSEQEDNRVFYSLVEQELKKRGHREFKLIEQRLLGYEDSSYSVWIEVELEHHLVRFSGRDYQEAVSRVPCIPIKVVCRPESTEAAKKIKFTMSNEPNLVISKKLLQPKSNPFYSKSYYQY